MDVLRDKTQLRRENRGKVGRKGEAGAEAWGRAEGRGVRGAVPGPVESGEGLQR